MKTLILNEAQIRNLRIDEVIEELLKEDGEPRMYNNKAVLLYTGARNYAEAAKYANDRKYVYFTFQNDTKPYPVKTNLPPGVTYWEDVTPATGQVSSSQSPSVSSVTNDKLQNDNSKSNDTIGDIEFHIFYKDKKKYPMYPFGEKPYTIRKDGLQSKGKTAAIDWACDNGYAGVFYKDWDTFSYVDNAAKTSLMERRDKYDETIVYGGKKYTNSISESIVQKALKIVPKLKSLNFNTTMAIAIAGNICVESNCNPYIVREKGNHNPEGLFQWMLTRRPAVLKWLSEQYPKYAPWEKITNESVPKDALINMQLKAMVAECKNEIPDNGGTYSNKFETWSKGITTDGSNDLFDLTKEFQYLYEGAGGQGDTLRMAYSQKIKECLGKK